MRVNIWGWMAAGLLAVPAAASALVVGDKDWRQLTETTGYTWNAVTVLCPVATGACTGVLSGWTWATNTEIRSLFNQLISPHQILSDTGFFGEADSAEIAAAIGTSAFLATSESAGPNGSELVAGWSRSPRPGSGLSATHAYAPRLYNPTNSVTIDYANLDTYYPIINSYPTIGIWLYRSPVPEPGTLALLGLGLAGLGLSRRRRAA